MIGDVIFFKKEGLLCSRIYNRIVKREFTHVGFVIAYDEVTGVATIVMQDGFFSTKISRIQLNDSHLIYSTGEKTCFEKERILKTVSMEVGRTASRIALVKKYFSLMFKGDKHDMFNIKNKTVCSIIGSSYYRAGIKRNNIINIGDVTPKQMLEAYDLKTDRKSDIYDKKEVRKPFIF